MNIMESDESEGVTNGRQGMRWARLEKSFLGERESHTGDLFVFPLSRFLLSILNLVVFVPLEGSGGRVIEIHGATLALAQASHLCHLSHTDADDVPGICCDWAFLFCCVVLHAQILT